MTDEDDGEDSTPFIDFLFILVICLLLLVAVKNLAATSDAPPPGSLMAEIGWPDGNHSDVDLWIFGPEEDRPVGFSHRSGMHFSLLRDDLGSRNDTLPINAEHSYAREVKAGRYVFNVHCYTCRSGPVTVGFEVSVTMNGVTRVLLATTVTLEFHGQELTVVQFELTKDGHIVPGSAHNVFKPLFRNWEQ